MLNKIKKLLSKTPEKIAPNKHDISLAVTAMMIEIMHSDGKLAEAEHNMMIESMKQRFGLTATEILALIEEANAATQKATDFHQFTSRIKDEYSTEERIAFLTDLWKIAMIDEHIDEYEEHLIRRVANLVGIYHGEFIQAKITAREQIK